MSSLNPTMRMQLKKNTKYKFLYYNKINDDIKNMQATRAKEAERIDSQLILPSVPFPKTTTRDIETLITKCSAGEELVKNLGLDGTPRTHKEKWIKIVEGIRSIMDFHFKSWDDNRKANELGKHLVEGDIFGEDEGMAVSSHIARRYTRQVFSPWRLLKAIDSKCQGSLNDSSVCDYCPIERDAGIVDFPRGQSLLPNRNQLTVCRNKMNELAKKVFKVEHNDDPTKCKHGDHVRVDYESLIRF